MRKLYPTRPGPFILCVILALFLLVSCATLQSFLGVKEECVKDWQVFFRDLPVTLKMPCAVPAIGECEFSYAVLGPDIGIIVLATDKDNWCAIYVRISEAEWIAVSCFSEDKFTHWICNDKGLPVRINKAKLIQALAKYLGELTEEHLKGLGINSVLLIEA